MSSEFQVANNEYHHAVYITGSFSVYNYKEIQKAHYPTRRMSKEFLTPSNKSPPVSIATQETADGHQSQALLVTGTTCIATITGQAEKESNEGRHSPSQLVTGVTKQTI